MVVRFFRLQIQGTNLTKLEAIKSWVETKIELNDLDERIGGGIPQLVEDSFNPGNYTLTLDMYIKTSINLDKYKDIIETEFTGLNKTGLTSAKVIQYDNCSHDSSNPQPCEPITRMEWNA